MSIKGKYTLQDFINSNECEKIPFEKEKYTLVQTADELR